MRKPSPLALVGLFGLICLLASLPAAAQPSGVERLAALLKRPDAGGTGPGGLSLTAADGTGLRLVSLRANAVVNGPLAFTELVLAFENPENRVREGRFEIVLPEGATITRFAMKIQGRWMEAEMVERQEARRVFESFLHVQRDPALLEHKAGNAFRARVFPIPARATKFLRVSYAQALTATRSPFRIRLAGLPRLDRLDVAVRIKQGAARGGDRVARLSRRGWAPTSDFTVPVTAARAGLRRRDLALVRVRPRIPSRVYRIPGLLILVDTSASRSLGWNSQVTKLGEVLSALRARHGKFLPVHVACFDQTVETIYKGAIHGFGDAHQGRIRHRRALGASDLEAALRWAAKVKRYSQVLLVTDGVPTAGATSASALRQLVRRLKPHVKRLDALVVGGIRDTELLRALVTGNLPQDGNFLEATQSAEALAFRLSETVHSGISVQVPGASWVWPEVLDGLQLGDERLVYASRRGNRPWGNSLTVKLGGAVPQTHRVRLSPAAGPLLHRAWVRARMAWLRQLGDNAYLRNRIRDLSIKHRVLSEYTALLVLETEDDYARFNINRRALADILVVGRRGVALKHRSWRRFRLPRRLVRPAKERARIKRGFQVLGNIMGGDDRVPRMRVPLIMRKERSGWKRGRGVAFRLARYRARKPLVFMSRASVSSGLDTSTLRRMIRRHHAEVRQCYQQELQAKPKLAGRVVLSFQIGQNGRVRQAFVNAKRSTLKNRWVHRCIAARARQWRFPEDEYSVYQVHYPFYFKPSDAEPKTRSQGSWRAAQRRLKPRLPSRPATANVNVTTPPPRPKPQRHPVALQPLAHDAYAGQMAGIKALIRLKMGNAALSLARRWRDREPGSVMALIALGEALLAVGRHHQAARAFGSIIDLYPSRADMRRYAGNRLLRLGQHGPSAALRKRAMTLATDAYAKALAQRPDHVTSYRQLGYAYLQQRNFRDAFLTLKRGFLRKYPEGRFGAYQRVLALDLGLVARAWLRAQPSRWKQIRTLVKHLGIEPATQPSVRFVLTWETDATNADLYVWDRWGDQFDWSRWRLPTGGHLVSDVWNGYGPEAFVVEGPPKGYPYQVRVTYANRGAMGYGLGAVQVVHHDGKGRLRFEIRPFEVMKHGATVDLGQVHRPRSWRISRRRTPTGRHAMTRHARRD